MRIFQHRPRCVPAAIALATLALSAPCLAPPARSQEHSALERLDRLERDLNMLQRQVYRGLPAPPMPPGGGAALVNTEIRMDRLEEQMRNLTGRVEELTNQVTQLRQRLEQVNTDVDMRVGQTAGTSRPLAATEAPAAAPAPRRFPPPPDAADAADDEAPPPRVATAPGRGFPPPPGGPLGDAPIPIFGTLTPPGTRLGAPPAASLAGAPPEAEPATRAAAARPVAAALPGGSPAAQYNHAFGLLKHADYAGAETALRDFVDQHPKDPLAGNAQYWLGETYYARGRYLEAASAFAEGYKRYPKSGKAPDGLLKLSMSLARANQKQNACVALAQLDRDFPHAGASVKQHAATEKKRLGC
ncbi:MAG: tol-pal system protein YbgF [Thiohalocapsa sp.]